jgi:hypothetical protein
MKTFATITPEERRRTIEAWTQWAGIQPWSDAYMDEHEDDMTLLGRVWAANARLARYICGVTP